MASHNKNFDGDKKETNVENVSYGQCASPFVSASCSYCNSKYIFKKSKGLGIF